MYCNNKVNFQESATILNAATKKSLESYGMHQVQWKYETIPILIKFI